MISPASVAKCRLPSCQTAADILSRPHMSGRKMLNQWLPAYNKFYISALAKSCAAATAARPNTRKSCKTYVGGELKLPRTIGVSQIRPPKLPVHAISNEFDPVNFPDPASICYVVTAAAVYTQSVQIHFRAHRVNGRRSSRNGEVLTFQLSLHSVYLTSRETILIDWN